MITISKINGEYKLNLCNVKSFGNVYTSFILAICNTNYLFFTHKSNYLIYILYLIVIINSFY